MTKLPTVDIKGKKYVLINDRLKYFRENYPNYCLETHLAEVNGESALIRAIIRDDKDRIVATGSAYERADNGFINKTSHVENCETSAWGRALANFGIGIDESIASAHEVANAVLQQNRPTKPSYIQKIEELAKDLKTTPAVIYTSMTGGQEPNQEQAITVIKTLKQKLSDQLDAS